MLAEKSIIYLIGLPGSGKSRYGKKIARYLNWNYIDTDKEIETIEKKSVSDIFAQEGEDYFRNTETAYLHNLIDSDNDRKVVSTGGGLPCHENNMSLIKETGISIYLKTPTHILTKRILTDESRPMFKDQNKMKVQKLLDTLLERREKDYEQADYVIEFNEKDLWNRIRETIDYLIEKKRI